MSKPLLEEILEIIDNQVLNYDLEQINNLIHQLSDDNKELLQIELYDNNKLRDLCQRNQLDFAKLLVDNIPPSTSLCAGLEEYLQSRMSEEISTSAEILHDILVIIQQRPFHADDEEFEEYPENTAFTPLSLKKLEDESLQNEQTDQKYEFKRKLTGRGQDGLAGFYDNLLIKEDKEATCVAEGTAYWVQTAGLLPPAFAKAVNYAKAGLLTKSDKSQTTISIQDEVAPSEGGRVLPWDEVILGVKRDPKTIYSIESWNAESIVNKINGLNSEAKLSLAAAIAGSVLAGDESLHIAQFMAILDKDQKVISIIRIDLGARERFSLARSLSDTDENPYQTSSQYQSSGQFGKNYLGYLLASPSLHRRYTQIWTDLSNRFPKHDALKQQIIANSKNAMIAQFSGLTADLKKIALTNFLAEVNKGVTDEHKIRLPEQSSIDEQVNFFAESVATIDANRTIKMMKVALKMNEDAMFVLENSIYQGQQMQDLSKEIADMSSNIFLGIKKNIPVDINIIKNNMQNIKAILNDNFRLAENKTLLEQLRTLSELTLMQLETEQLRLLNEPERDDHQLQITNQEIERFQTITDCIDYVNKTQYPEKQNLVAKIIEKALISNEEIINHIGGNTHLYDKLAQQGTVGYYASYVAPVTGKKGQAGGASLLQSLSDRYHLNQGKWNLTSRDQKQLVNNLSVAQNFCAQSYLELKNNPTSIKVDSLLKKQTNVDKQLETFAGLLQQIIENDDHEILAALLGQTIIAKELIAELLNKKNAAGQTTLIQAAAFNKPKCVRRLMVEEKFTLTRSAADKLSNTTLHYLAKLPQNSNNIRAIVALLKKSTWTGDPGAMRDQNNDTPLHLLIKSGAVSTLQEIEKDCGGIFYHFKNALNVSNDNRMTPIMLAALNSNLALIDLLAGSTVMALSPNAIAAYKQIALVAGSQKTAREKSEAIELIVNNYETTLVPGLVWGKAPQGALPGFEKAYLVQQAPTTEPRRSSRP